MSWKPENIKYVRSIWRTLQNTPPPHLLYLKPSQHWANSDRAMTEDKYKYKYTNLAYNMALQGDGSIDLPIDRSTKLF
jgi:hypothetical protein